MPQPASRHTKNTKREVNSAKNQAHSLRKSLG